ncbi:MAG: hypothetical protein QOG15_2945 [Solirubrobacteraceae bacterium]|jgi:outer membrane murein-binding lipoprotein Lpp|nr:hypothetical protein [Solirubrobacteraceae bacterium]
MSNPPPPDRPTEPLRPAPRAPVVEERVVAPAVDPNIILLRLEDAVASLRTGLMFVGVIAVAALAVGLYALLSNDDTSRGSRTGLASDARVSRLSDRVDRLSRQVQDLRAGGNTSALDARVRALETTVRTLAKRPVAKDPTQAIEQLSSRVDTLTQDVDQLKQAQGAP